jgi:hypothetical protein
VDIWFKLSLGNLDRQQQRGGYDPGGKFSGWSGDHPKWGLRLRGEFQLEYRIRD